jgi:uncharacterized protein
MAEGRMTTAAFAFRMFPKGGTAMFNIIPREEKYFELFDQMAEKMNLAAAVLIRLFDDIASAEQYAAELGAVEHEADEITHEVLKRLTKSFITPIDREDIHSLISAMDTVVDLIESVAARVIMYGVREATPAMRELAGVLAETASATGRSVLKIHSHEDMTENIVEVHNLEAKGDAMFRSAMRELFAGSTDALNIMKCKEVYERLESAIDACEGAANVVENIKLKNA